MLALLADLAVLVVLAVLAPLAVLALLVELMCSPACSLVFFCLHPSIILYLTLLCLYGNNNIYAYLALYT